MAKSESFDITTGCEPQEVDNALNQARKEITNRYDFKNVLADITYDGGAGTISIHTSDDFKLDAIWQVLVGRFVARNVPVENVQRGDVEPATGGTVRQTMTLVQAIDSDTARKINKFIRDQKLKKVQSQIQNDAVRVSAPNRDDLQLVMAALRAEDWGMQLNYGNYR
jgi:uncharacterized protein YajQ (UPF0234 family)